MIQAVHPPSSQGFVPLVDGLSRSIEGSTCLTNNWKSSSKDNQNGCISFNLSKLHDSYKILEIFIKHIHQLSHEIMPSTERHAHKVIRNRHLQGVTSELDMAIPWKCHETSHPPHFPPSEKKHKATETLKNKNI